MYRGSASHSFEILKKTLNDKGRSQPPGDLNHLFHELGLAIVGSNLEIKYPHFPPEALKRQYERMLGVSLEDRHEPGLKEAVDPCSFDVLGRLYEDIVRANGTRNKVGEFFTPPFVVDYMVDLLDLDGDGRLRERKLIDIACGTGAFMVSAMRKMIRSLTGSGMAGDDALQHAVDNLYGLDISSASCDICRINMYLVLLDELGPDVLSRAGGVRFNVFATNSIDLGDADGTIVSRIKRRLGEHADGFDYILGNPPYLEAKKMPAALKKACRESWPGLSGAFDLYVPFILQCNRIVSEGGKVCLILPDKFTVARYAMSLRETLLRDFSLIEVADLAAMDVFDRAMVYPAVIAYKNSPPAPGHIVRTRTSIGSPEELAGRRGFATAQQELYRSIGSNRTFFCLPEEGDIAGMLRRIFDEGAPVRDLVDFRSTVSFHVKGLREEFVRKSFGDVTGPIVKYLGGRSYARRNEVGLFGFRWEGYHINYDQAALKEYGNALPPLANFLREKVVLCQHARRITAAYDGGGEFVTKDVYPIGIATPGLARSYLSLKYFTALLNSELMSFIYGTVYKGIQIGGGYYHYLPTWLGILPVIVPARPDVEKIERLADRMMAADDPATRLRLMGKVDDAAYRIYAVSDAQRDVIGKFVPAWNAGIS